MVVRLYELYPPKEKDLRDLCQKHFIRYREKEKYEMFEFSIDDGILLSSTTRGVKVSIKANSDCVFIEPDMFYYIEII